ncbi:MAG TPA: hypothetical protein VFQ71_14015 [Gaiellales bacterium]|nr:hypothetical protein [Gaiellales bacterium]
MSADELARRLREEGTAQAPPDLAPEVMRQVAREPRNRRRSWPSWRPVAVWATAGAAIAAGGFAISQLGTGGSSSSASSAATRAALGEAAPSTPPAFIPLPPVYTVASRDAARILQAAGVTPSHMSYVAPHHRRIVAAIPRSEMKRVAGQLRIAQRNPGPGTRVLVRIVPRG